MNCSGYERQMADYLDGQLSRAKEDALRFHMNGCLRCRLKIEDMESSIRAVKSLSPVTPQPQFDYRLSTLLTQEITREFYASTWRRRVSAMVGELGELGRQRPVQLVFATSLILTITVIGGFAGRVAPPERSASMPAPSMALSLPTPFESELAPPDPISPFPLERELAPHMAMKPTPNAAQSSSLPSSAATSFSFPASRFAHDDPGIMTVSTMEPTIHGIRTVSTGAGIRLNPSLFTESIGRDLLVSGSDAGLPAFEERLQRVGTTGVDDPNRAVNGSTRPSGLPAPIRRIRISF